MGGKKQGHLFMVNTQISGVGLCNLGWRVAFATDYIVFANYLLIPELKYSEDKPEQNPQTRASSRRGALSPSLTNVSMQRDARGRQAQQPC